MLALATADDVIRMPAADARREIFERIDIKPHALEHGGDEIARGKTAVAGLAAEQDLDVIEDHAGLIPPLVIPRDQDRGTAFSRSRDFIYHDIGSLLSFQQADRLPASDASEQPRCRDIRRGRFADSGE